MDCLCEMVSNSSIPSRKEPFRFAAGPAAKISASATSMQNAYPSSLFFRNVVDIRSSDILKPNVGQPNFNKVEYHFNIPSFSLQGNPIKCYKLIQTINSSREPVVMLDNFWTGHFYMSFSLSCSITLNFQYYQDQRRGK